MAYVVEERSRAECIFFFFRFKRNSVFIRLMLNWIPEILNRIHIFLNEKKIGGKTSIFGSAVLLAFVVITFSFSFEFRTSDQIFELCSLENEYMATGLLYMARGEKISQKSAMRIARTHSAYSLCQFDVVNRLANVSLCIVECGRCKNQ